MRFWIFFIITIFTKKKSNIFQNNCEKSLGEGVCDNFSENGLSDDKNESNLFYGKLSTKYGFKIFSSKNPYWLNKRQNPSFRGTFSPISVVLLDRLFPKKKKKKKGGFTHVWIRTNHANFVKICSKLRPVSGQ